MKNEKTMSEKELLIWDIRDIYLNGDNEGKKFALDKLLNIIKKMYPNNEKKVSVVYEANKAWLNDLLKEEKGKTI